MSYKWKWRPTKAQARAFAEKMRNDPEFADAYYKRQMEKEKKRMENSKFDYPTAGGYYVPFEYQFKAAFDLMADNPTDEQRKACEQVFWGYSCQQKIHHDHIHIINEYIRDKA